MWTRVGRTASTSCPSRSGATGERRRPRSVRQCAAEDPVGSQGPDLNVPGELEAPQHYNDEWRGWPVRPHGGPHPIRGSFLDPRADVRLGAVYHDGLDIAVR